MADRQTLERRWLATETCLASLSDAQVAELATSIVRREPASPEWFRQIYKAADDVMPTRAIDEEMRVLAAVVLRISVENNDDTSTTAALALLAAAFGMKDEPTWLGEHLKEAAKSLSERGRNLRQVSRPSTVADLTLEAVGKSIERVENLVESLSEANNCLWWAFTKRSESLDLDYRVVGIPAIAVAAPADLFRVVSQIPAAPEAETILLHVVSDTAGTGERDFSFKNYISALGRDQASSLRVEVPQACALLCPLMWAVSAAAGGKPWASDFEKRFKLKTATTFSLEAIALQGFRELCLIESFAG